MLNSTIQQHPGGSIAAHEAIDATRLDRKAIERKVRSSIAECQARLTSRTVEEARHALREILVGPVTLIPEGRAYRFEGETLVGSLLAGKLVEGSGA